VSRPDRDGCFVVFSQAERARADVIGWDAHARRFFRTQLSPVSPAHDEASDNGGARIELRVAPDGEPEGIRRVQGRPREPEDLALAEAADAAGTGLALLARRCPTVWLVARTQDDDRLALRLSAILASVGLGPILDARVPELLGVKSARARFEAG
jgi:hypothetical protein